MSEYTRIIKRVQESVETNAEEWKKAQEDIARTLREAPSASDGTIPSLGEMVGANYGLAVRMLELNQDLALGWLRAMFPSGGWAATGRKSATTT